ncbi:bifunctional nuclease family protein [uncultured Muribaculum sp.]|uniref:bifunctional nuclease family protein n=2 Tax=uncultured Muribaculum sp. TaxID=1918613 RepID=UPI0026314545|nr:bifunctional nuclease family protein [uncultured Muribaculum sp.]
MSMEDEKIRLKVLGISYSHIQSGAYALILSQVGGPYKIPVVIGAAEAQSIAIRMEKIITPRPMTHDLFVSFAHAFGVKLKQIFIYKFEDGIFSSELTFADEERTVVLDARTSDAISLAMRTNAPIFTTKAILDETGFLMEEVGEASDDAGSEPDGDSALGKADETGFNHEPKLEQYTVEELERTLKKLIEAENYEQAAKVSEVLKRKRGE